MPKGISVFGKKIAARRDALYKTQPGVAREAGMSVENLKRIEGQEVAGMGPKYFPPLAAALKWSIEEAERELLVIDDAAAARGAGVSEDMWERFAKGAAEINRNPVDLFVEFMTVVERKAARKRNRSRIKPRRRKMKTLDEHGKIIEHS